MYCSIHGYGLINDCIFHSLVVYVKRLERHYGDPPKKSDPSHPAFQGHLKVIGT